MLNEQLNVEQIVEIVEQIIEWVNEEQLNVEWKVEY